MFRIIPILDKIIKYSSYILVFLLPFFFLPFGNVLDFNKQALTIFLVSIGFLAATIKIFLEKLSLKEFFLKIPLNFLIFLFLILYFLSSWFSDYRYGSFFGFGGRPSESFISLVAFLMLYFLLINFFSRKEILNLIYLLFFSGILTLTYAILQLLGRFNFPFQFLAEGPFNPFGTYSQSFIFLASLLPFLIYLFYSKDNQQIKLKSDIITVIFIFLVILLCSFLIVINSTLGWGILALAMILILSFGIPKFYKSQKTSFLTLATIILLLSITFFVFRIPLFRVFSLPIEVHLGKDLTFSIIQQSFKKNLEIGTGPGTFSFYFQKYKPASFNQGDFWNVNFQQGYSAFSDRLIEIGIFGTLSLFLIAIFLIVFAIRRLKKVKEEKDFVFGLCLLSSFLIIFLASFFYPINFNLAFLFWFLAGVLIKWFSEEKPPLKLKRKEKMSFGLAYFFPIIFLILISLLFFAAKNYLAAIQHTQALTSLAKGDLEKSQNLMQRAIFFNNKNDLYFRDLSQIYALKIARIFQDEELSPEERVKNIQNLINRINETSQKACDISPENFVNFLNRANLYQTFNSWGIQGAGDLAINLYQEAAKLSPQNPQISLEIGRVYQTQGNLDLAVENFQKALDLKPNYPDALYLLGDSYLKKGKKEKAKEYFNEVLKLDPQNQLIQNLLKTLEGEEETK